jgi:hypothetical protein
MRTHAIVAILLLVGATTPAFAQTSGRLQVEKLRAKYPRTQRVYATGAKASSSYGRGYMASEVVGPPNVFPRFKDGKGAWACKDKRSKSEWLEVTFPSTAAKALIVFETWKPDGITKILIGNKVVYKAGAYRSRGRALGLCVEFGGALTITKVRIELDPTRVSYYPEIDAVALVPVGGAAAPSPSGEAKPPAGGVSAQANVAKALVLITAVEKGYPTLKNGDVPAANVFLKKIKAANALLGACKDRRALAWQEAYRRSRAVDANIRAVAGRRPAAGSTPTVKRPAAGGAEEPNVTKARVLIEAAEKGASTLKDGDIPAGNVLLAKVKEAFALLSACTDRRSPAFKKAVTRVKAVQTKIFVSVRRRPGAGSTPTAKKPPAQGAVDPQVAQALAELDLAEAGLAKLEDGDKAQASALLKRVITAKGLLNATKSRTQEWFSAWNRSSTLYNGIQRVGRKRKKTTGSAAGDEKRLVQARAMLDAIERKLASLKAGDVGARDALQAEFDSARQVLKGCRFRHRKTYAAELRRYSRLTDKMSNAFDGLDPEKLAIKAMGPPTNRGPAIGEAVFFGNEVFAMRTGAEVMVFATGAVASSQRGRASAYSSAQATGAPNVFPSFVSSQKAWAPRSSDTKLEWLEVGFPKTLTRCVYIYQNKGTHRIRLISDQSGAVLVGDTAKMKRESNTAQVLCITLPKAREIDRLWIGVNAKPRTGRSDGAQIDAVALGAKGMNDGGAVFTKANSKALALLVRDLESARSWVAKTVKKQRTFLLKGSDDLWMLDNVRAMRKKLKGTIENHRSPQVLKFLADVAALEAEINQHGVVGRKELLALGKDPMAQAEAHGQFIQTKRKKHNRIYIKVPKAWTPEAYSAFGKEYRVIIGKLKKSLDYLERVQRWVPKANLPFLKSWKRELSALPYPVGGDIEVATKAQAIDPRNSDTKALQAMARNRKAGGHAHYKYTKAIEALKVASAFETSYLGKPSDTVVSMSHDLITRRKALDTFIEAQIATERWEYPKGSASLIKIAKGMFKDSLRMGIVSPVETKSGTRESRSLVDTTQAGGGMVRKRYRITSTPYKYKFFRVAVATADPERPGYARVVLYWTQYNITGGRTRGKWYWSSKAEKQVMLVKNLP